MKFQTFATVGIAVLLVVTYIIVFAFQSAQSPEPLSFADYKRPLFVLGVVLLFVLMSVWRYIKHGLYEFSVEEYHLLQKRVDDIHKRLQKLK